MTRILSQLFDQKTALENFVRKLEHEHKTIQAQLQGELDKIQNKLDDTQNKLDDSVRKFISLCFKFNLSEGETVDRLEQVFSFSQEHCVRLVSEYKKESNIL